MADDANPNPPSLYEGARRKTSELPTTTDMDVVDFVINKGHGVGGLAKMGLKSVPKIYVQPPEERFDSSKVVVDDLAIPVIDVSDIETDPGVGEKVCSAARKNGFFQIVNHGIPEETLAAMMDAGRRFFEQPTEDKFVFKNNSIFGGSATFGTSFRPESEKVFEWKDYLHLRYISDEDAALSWPPICKNESLEYRERVLDVVRKLYDVLLKGLNIEGGFEEARSSLLMGSTSVHYNCYPPCPNPELTTGISRHSDKSCLTVLVQDDVGGLYVRAEDGGESWIYVPPIKGAMVINVGDALQILSNGQYKSIEHKVEVNSDKTRISLASFITPLHNLMVGPLPEVLTAGEKPLYRDVLYGDYLKYFLGKAHYGKAAIDRVKI